MSSWNTSLLKESTSHLIRNQRILHKRASANETKRGWQKRKRNERKKIIEHAGCQTPTWLYLPQMRTSLIWLSLTLIPAAAANRLMNRSQINSKTGSKCANRYRRNFKCGRTKTSAAIVQDGMKPRSVRSLGKVVSNSTIAYEISLQPHRTDMITAVVFITDREEGTIKVTAMAKSTETGTMLIITPSAQMTPILSGMTIITKRLPIITLNRLSKADKMLSIANTILTSIIQTRVTTAHSSNIRTIIINRATERSFLITKRVRNSTHLKSRK